MASKDNITLLTEEDRENLLNKSTKRMPENPSQKGFSGDQVKASMYEPSVLLFKFIQRLQQELGASFDAIDTVVVGKIDVNKTILTAQNISALGNLNQYENGQKFLIGHILYELVGNENLQPIFDFDSVIDGKIVDVEVTKTDDESSISYEVNLLNESEETVVSFNIEIQSATSTKAGLMSAEDKATLDAVPETYESQEHAESTYVNQTTHTADIGALQEQIDAFESKTDVVDVVALYDRGTDTTKSDLVHYDTSKLSNNDVVKVLRDNNPLVVGNPISYYRFNKTDENFNIMGSIGPYYTVGEADARFLSKINAAGTYQRKIIYSIEEPQDAPIGTLWATKTANTGFSIFGDGFAFDLATHTVSVDYTIVAKKAELFSGSYDDLTNKPTIPTKTSDLTNDSGFLTEHQDISGKLDKIVPTTEGTIVYASSVDGQGETTQGSIVVSESAIQGTIVKRKSNGRVEVSTPTENNDATTKAYVDGKVGNYKITSFTETETEISITIAEV